MKPDPQYQYEDEIWPENAPTLDISPFWLGIYPVTVAQFRPFVESDGYTNPEYWTEAGWKWRQDEDWRAPDLWDDPLWCQPEQPVIGVSWYEAVAYCRWLTQHLIASGQSGWVVRLPTEAEWEWAARGPEARRWPWGDSWEAGRCNTEETGINRTSPVGTFPGGANWTRDFPQEGQGEGVHDLAGNVFEWCSTRWQEKYPLPLFPSEWTPYYLTGDDDDPRMLRGGSWIVGHTRARGARRDWFIPDRGNDSNGFWCCVATSSLE